MSENLSKLYLIRHGQTCWNQKKRFQGQTDVDLDEKGFFQAQCIADYFKDKKVDAIFASDLLRAVHTAVPLSKAKNLPIQTDERLRETRFGLWEGQTFEQIQKTYPDLVFLWQNKPLQLQIPGGETFLEVAERSYQAIVEISLRNIGKHLAIFCHGGALRLLMCRLLEIPLDKLWHLQQYNAGITIIDLIFDEKVQTFKNCRPVLTLFNSTVHLD